MYFTIYVDNFLLQKAAAEIQADTREKLQKIERWSAAKNILEKKEVFYITIPKQYLNGPWYCYQKLTKYH